MTTERLTAALPQDVDKHRIRLAILEKHIGGAFYDTGHLHNCIIFR